LENHQQTYWQVWTLLWPVPRLGKLHRLATRGGAHRTGDRESTRLVNKELSDLWKISTPEGHSISEPFTPEEFAAALRRKVSGIGFHLSGIYTPCQVGFNLIFATSSLPACANSKFQRSGEDD